MPEFTPNLALTKPNFNVITWHDEVNGNFDILDAAIAALTLDGLWENSTAYVIGNKVVDADDATIWLCNVNHLSAATGDFAADRTLHPTYWSPVEIGEFTSLLDVPSSYVGAAGKALRVKATEDGIEFANIGTSRTTREVNAAGSITADAEDDDIIFVNKTVGAATAVTLPTAQDRIDLASSRPITIIDGKLDADTNNITINPNGSETILGLSSWILNSIGAWVNLSPRPDGTGWFIC